MKSPREKAADLVRLATAVTASPGERENAALAACRMIERHGLLSEDPRSYRAPAPTRVTLRSEEVSLGSSCLCRACMQRIEARVPCHRIEGRGYQCQDCGPWTADAVQAWQD